MTGETQDGWKTKFPEKAADLEWWEAAFGKGNIAGWTGRSRAVVKLSGALREVDPALREWALETRALAPAIDRVIAEVETRYKGGSILMPDDSTTGGHWFPPARVVLDWLRALRAEQSASGARGGGETEAGS